MDELTKLIPNLPEWISIPLVIIVLLLGLWPKIRRVFRDLSSTYRAYEVERRRFELLKLRLEIEVIVKEHSLDFDLANIRLEEKLEAPPPPPNGINSGASMWQMVTVGALGAIMPSIMRLPNNYELLLGADSAITLGFILSIVIFGFLGSITVYSMRPANFSIAFLIGFAITALIQLLMGSIT